jgi:hypothetical protein
LEQVKVDNAEISIMERQIAEATEKVKIMLSYHRARKSERGMVRLRCSPTTSSAGYYLPLACEYKGGIFEHADQKIM